MNRFDVIVIGAGAAGMMCAAQAGQRGCSVLLIDHSEQIAEKIRISGGGRCNFTNKEVNWRHFVSANPQFAEYALAHYQPADFIRLMRKHHLSYTEKHKGQLFCDQKSQAIIHMLCAECHEGHVINWRPCKVYEISKNDSFFRVFTTQGEAIAQHLVIATGGLPVPKIGATDFGIHVAKQFKHSIVETAPALVPLIVRSQDWSLFSGLSGVGLSGRVSTSSAAQVFDEDVLITHQGLSGPAILQISSYWRSGDTLALNCSGYSSQADLLARLQERIVGSKASFQTLIIDLFAHWPKRFITAMLEAHQFNSLNNRKAAELGKSVLNQVSSTLYQWHIKPDATAGYAKAEVMRGGVSTADLCPKTLQSKHVPGLYFIGEVVDITGWLGGYNFQWAWASGVAAAKSVANRNNVLD